MDPAALLLFFMPLILFCLCVACCKESQRGTIYSNPNFPWGFVLFILLLILFSMCTHSCREQRGAVIRTPVVVTSATHTAPGGYPVGVHTTTVYPTTSSGYQQAVYPQQATYPTMGAPTGMPMPMPMQQGQMNPSQMGFNTAVNPPYPTTAAAPYPTGTNFTNPMNPPSYDHVVGSNQAAYEKQAPYNPGYTTGY